MPGQIAFSADAKYILAANDEGQVFLVNAATGQRLPMAEAHRGPVSALFFSSDDTEAFSAGLDGSLRRWSVQTGKPLDPIFKAGAAITAADAGRRLLATGTSKGGVQLWDRASGKLLAEMAHAAAVNVLAIRADEAVVFSASADATVRLWRPDSGPIGNPLKHEAAVTTLALAPGNQYLATGTGGGIVHLYDVSGIAQLMQKLDQRGQITALVWAPNGTTLAIGSSSGDIVLWDLGSGRQIAGPARHDGSVTALAYSPDGVLLASSSEDGTARCWLGDSLIPAGDAARHAAKVLGLAWEPGGKSVATRASDGRVGHWLAPKGEAVWAPVALELVAGPAPPPAPLDSRTFVRVGTDRLVTVGGITGLFTPLGGDPGKPLGSDERANLLGLIDSLKRELAGAQGRGEQLSADLDSLRQRSAPAADFASGVQQSLDELQLRLSSMRNPVANFAVRELKLEAGVAVQIGPTGTIEYRFLQPGDDMPASAVSRLSINVVPLPKDNLAGVWTSNLFQPERALTDLPDISNDQAQRLEAQGMFSIGEFVQASTRVRAQAFLVALLEVDRTRLALWAQQAGLMTLRGVDGRVAATLIGAGLGSFDVLARVLPAEVLARYTAEREAQPQRNAPAITEATAALWVRAARQYLGLPVPDDQTPSG